MANRMNLACRLTTTDSIVVWISKCVNLCSEFLNSARTWFGKIAMRVYTRNGGKRNDCYSA
ncbi:hypothetical protein BDF19DRAFT_453372 [Syncephalis fuscata]|nr:hypothetical protein BDF19DRAFT_453372 [Syncephalis fuscata]